MMYWDKDSKYELADVEHIFIILGDHTKKYKWQIPSEFDDKVDEEILDKVRNFKGYYPGVAGQQLQQ